MNATDIAKALKLTPYDTALLKRAAKDKNMSSRNLVRELIFFALKGSNNRTTDNKVHKTK